MSKRQKLYMPKMDTEMERIWPDPSVHMHSEHSKHMRGKEAAAAMWERFLEVLPDDDPSAGWSFDTCAVVGNGGSLRLYEQGGYINKHDCVIRFNRGPTAGFERHVG
ncbi:hypothetical protein CYMTET_17475 [Cymbomonas tetramitiformis]|uniref:Uncharacterized protein n=1 Tax=Cymbomonas tetramitiformis TaxID=36881 RepID=A0AAE0L791_9CHLO|nr:hypothetical protein CYMTET_17475 [Cymbomonas tetramitiformis]